jgi:hypothetical protein
VLNKFRVAVADKADALSGVITHSNCADDISNRLITAVAPAIGAVQDSIDVGGAYFHGTPPDMEHGGRCLFAHIPKWLSALFPDRYPQRGRAGGGGSGGSWNFLRITGNMPGRCDAGRIWQHRFDTFLLGFGLTQLLTDRRVWIKHSEAGRLILHDHVDDTRITATTAAVRLEFHSAWAAEFGETIVVRPLSEDFTGLRHTPLTGRTVAISCGGVIRRLGVLLLDFPLLAAEACDWPLPARAMSRLLEGPSARAPLVPDQVPAMQAILGTVGFITGMVRPDAFFAYTVLCRFVSVERLTSYATRFIVRLGHYLVATRDLALHITAPVLTSLAGGGTALDLFETFVDSSNGTWEEGGGIGGFVLSSRAAPEGPKRLPAAAGSSACGGALAWRCLVRREGDDSSGAAELRLATLAYKYTLAARFLLTELDVGVAPAGPTVFHLDAQAVLDGTSCERLAKGSRWMAMRYAMLRLGQACRSIEARKRPSAQSPSDGLTKFLTGVPFLNGRARLLGHAVPFPETPEP